MNQEVDVDPSITRFDPKYKPSTNLDICHTPSSLQIDRHGLAFSRLISVTRATDIKNIHIFLYKMANYCSQQSILHEKSRIWFKYFNYGLSIPAILLSTIAGSVNTISAVSEQDNCDGSTPTLHWINIMCGVVGLVAAGMLSVHRFGNYAELEQQHGHFCDSYEQKNLSIRTNILLDSGGESRTFTNLYEYLKHSHDEISRLIDKSPSLPVQVKNKYKAKKKLMEVSNIFEKH
jgi:hypothetical protein